MDLDFFSLLINFWVHQGMDHDVVVAVEVEDYCTVVAGCLFVGWHKFVIEVGKHWDYSFIQGQFIV